MARIVYGVAGEGSGHSSRAAEMVAFLEKRGHSVKVVSYGRGYKNLKDDFDVHRCSGLHIANRQNRVSALRTVLENLKRSPRIIRDAARIRRTLFKDFTPDCVITDFEPITAYLSWMMNVPLMTIDNQHRMRYMEHPTPENLRQEAFVTRRIIHRMIPRPDVSLITTFYFGKLKNNYSFLFPPILRQSLLDTKPKDGDHILVYLSFGYGDCLKILRSLENERFIVYGYDRDESEDNITFKPFSRATFLEDMASAKAVLSTAGFTTMTESLHFRKPMLAMPLRGQFEQELNGVLLQELEYGVCCRKISASAVQDFLERLPQFREKLETYPASDNSLIQDTLDRFMADDAALLKEFHENRKNGRDHPPEGENPNIPSKKTQ